MQMTRSRLTFDPNPKELARRDAAGTHAALLWSRRRHRAAIVVEDDATGDLVQLDIHDQENPLELNEHPYAYLTTRGHPGKRSALRSSPQPDRHRNSSRSLPRR